MKRSTYILLLALHAATARGQASGGVGAGGAWGFVNVRYDTRSSASIYTGYGWHGAFAMSGVLHNPRTGDAELIGGLGAAFRTGAEAHHWLVFATARAGDVSSAQIFWLPTVHTGVVTTRANAKWTAEYKRGAARKLTISPLSITMPLNRRAAGGVAMDMTAAHGARTSIGTGVEARFKIPGASIVGDALRDVTGHGSRFRVFFSSSFQ